MKTAESNTEIISVLPSSVIELPWRSFKAFTQLYDQESGIRPRPAQKLLLLSDSRAGERLRNGLLDKRLIAPDGGAQTPYRVLRGVPLSREPIPHIPSAPLVRPVNRSPQGKAWNQIKGCCAYCGNLLIWFEPYMTPALVQVAEDLPPLLACKSCHATRGGRSLEDMRHLLAMRYFEYQNNIRFSDRQIAWLNKQGFELQLPEVDFWFERVQKETEKSCVS